MRETSNKITEITTGATFHMAQSHPEKLSDCKSQGLTEPQDKTKSRRSINGFKDKGSASD